MDALPTKLYTVEQAGQYLLIPEKRIRTWLREGRLHGYKLGGEWRISEEDLEEFLASGYTGNKPQTKGE
ncbi:MAG: helix-turn-helix domain-containing protein [Peptococcaceae bacterium]|nr:helix-turn-helix domain-containing protein [Peptococcaceae bacterium]